MQFEMIAKADAPAQGPERRKRRMPQIEEMVGQLEPGMVARIQLGEDEKPRPVLEAIYKAAARRNKVVDVWEVGGLLYAEAIGGEG
jgi:hypothetical protein